VNDATGMGGTNGNGEPRRKKETGLGVKCKVQEEQQGFTHGGGFWSTKGENCKNDKKNSEKWGRIFLRKVRIARSDQSGFAQGEDKGKARVKKKLGMATRRAPSREPKVLGKRPP